MYSQPARRRAETGLAGARDRQVPADRHYGRYEDYLRRHEMEAKQATRSGKSKLEEFANMLLPRAADTRNIMLAIEHCADRSQAAGPDGLSNTELDRQAMWDLAGVLTDLMSDGSYMPSEPFVMLIDKGGNRGQRTIHIPNAADRAVERAVLQIIRPITQSYYLGTSMGFRHPGISREQALITAEHLANTQDRWVWISQDFRDAFENVPRGRLFQLLRKMLIAEPICNLIERITAKPGKRGIRQGGPLSPELLNVYLHWTLDVWWQRRFPTVPMLRVADDLLILARPEEAESLHVTLEKRCREIGMPLKHAREEATIDLETGATNWLGYDICLNESGIQPMITDRAWLKLEENLQRAGEKPAPSLAAIDSINGWIGQQGAAYRRDDVRMVYTGIASRAQEAGFDEIPYCEEVATRWYQAYLRDWANPRETLRIRGLDMGSATECADGFADQHCDFATIHGRGGLTCLTDTPPQTVPPIRREVFLYCDGSCLHRHGVGGWAFLVSEPETGWQDAQAGSEDRATNNRMELMAVIEGLASLQDSTLVHLVVDSEYVHLGITERLATWVSNGWRAGRIRTRPLKNLELWQRLAAQLDRHDVDSQWVRAHSGQEQNDLVDRLAKDAVIMRCMQMTS